MAALFFALIYSKQLGLERRGLLTFIMTANMIFSILLISGVSLHVRSLTKDIDISKRLGVFIVYVFFSSFLTPFLNLLALNLFQYIYKISVPKNLFLVSLIYCFFSTLIFGLYDVLLLTKNIKLASALDLAIIVIQSLSYFTLVYSGEASYFNSILISMSISYLVTCFSILVLISHVYHLNINFSYNSLKELIQDSTTPTFIALASQLIDRLDKVYLGLLSGIGELGRYSTTQSIISVIRFFPDSVGKLIIARDRNFFNFKKNAVFLLAALLICIVGAFSITFIVALLLGSEWVLPLFAVLLLIFVEWLRGTQYLINMNLIRSINYGGIRKITVIQVILGVMFQPILIYNFGIGGAVISSVLIYLVGILGIRVIRNA
jgi:O-antigen/teichoic acid export membrane protein